MRKRSLFEFFDMLLWTFIGLLPIIYSLITCVYKSGDTLIFRSFESGLVEFFSTGGYNMTYTNNILYGALVKMFSTASAPYGFYLGSQSILKAIAFFGTVQILHFVLDVLLFIPRIAMRLCDKFSK